MASRRLKWYHSSTSFAMGMYWPMFYDVACLVPETRHHFGWAVLWLSKSVIYHFLFKTGKFPNQGHFDRLWANAHALNEIFGAIYFENLSNWFTPRKSYETDFSCEVRVWEIICSSVYIGFKNRNRGTVHAK